MITTVYLHGAIGKQFTTVWTLDVERVSEVIRALCYLKPELRGYLNSSARRGVAYRVSTEAGVLSENQLNLPATQEVHIRPIVMGSKRAGTFQLILGVVLIAASIWVAGADGGAGAKAGLSLILAGKATGSAFFFYTGVSMVLGGVSTLLATPSGDGYTGNKDDSRSYLFGGPSRSTMQGVTLPVGYGRLHIGGIPVSTDLVNSSIPWNDNYAADGTYIGGAPNDSMDGLNSDLPYWGWIPSGGVGAPGTPGNPYVPPTLAVPVLPTVGDSPPP